MPNVQIITNNLISHPLFYSSLQFKTSTRIFFKSRLVQYTFIFSTLNLFF